MIIVITANLLEFIQIINIKIYSLLNYHLIMKITIIPISYVFRNHMRAIDISTKNISTVIKNSKFQIKSDAPIFMEINTHFSPHLKLFSL